MKRSELRTDRLGQTNTILRGTLGQLRTISGKQDLLVHQGALWPRLRSLRMALNDGDAFGLHSLESDPQADGCSTHDKHRKLRARENSLRFASEQKLIESSSTMRRYHD